MTRQSMFLTQSIDASTVSALEASGMPQMKKRLYLDACTLCRPYDDQTGLKVRLETDAYYLILAHVELGRYSVVVSPVHLAEIDAIPDHTERVEVQQLLKRLGSVAICSPSEARKRAGELTRLKFGVADAAHVAYAEASADVFVTCDVRLHKRCKRYGIRIPAYAPVEFVTVEGLE